MLPSSDKMFTLQLELISNCRADTLKDTNVNLKLAFKTTYLIINFFNCFVSIDMFKVTLMWWLVTFKRQIVHKSCSLTSSVHSYLRSSLGSGSLSQMFLSWTADGEEKRRKKHLTAQTFSLIWLSRRPLNGSGGITDLNTHSLTRTHTHALQQPCFSIHGSHFRNVVARHLQKTSSSLVGLICHTNLWSTDLIYAFWRKKWERANLNVFSWSRKTLAATLTSMR